MSRLYDMVRAVRRSLGPWGDRTVNLVHYGVVYGLPFYRANLFFNGGYFPLLPGFRGLPELEREPLQANMYEFAARELVGDPLHRPRTILELGCGRGGGLVYLASLFPEAGITGIDANRSAVRDARRRFSGDPRIEVLRRDGGATGLPDASFDFVVSVGTMTYVGIPAFLREVARLAKPGAAIAATGGVTGHASDYMHRFIAHCAGDAGLRLESYVDTTRNTFAALRHDIPRREALVGAMPAFVRGYAREWSDLPGTARYEKYASGERVDFAVLLRRDGAPLPQAGSRR